MPQIGGYLVSGLWTGIFVYPLSFDNKGSILMYHSGKV
jgi:hypothetical protein